MAHLLGRLPPQREFDEAGAEARRLVLLKNKLPSRPLFVRPDPYSLLQAGLKVVGPASSGLPLRRSRVIVTPSPPPQAPSPPPQAPSPPPSLVPIRRMVVNFHFTGESTAGVSLNEVRVFGPIARPFEIESVEVFPVSNVQIGQFLDILISDDTDVSDTTTPTGFSIFQPTAALSGAPALDTERGVAIPTSPMDLPCAFRVFAAQKAIKARLFALSPATTLPILNVSLIVNELVEDEREPEQEVPVEVPQPEMPEEEEEPMPEPSPILPRVRTRRRVGGLTLTVAGKIVARGLSFDQARALADQFEALVKPKAGRRILIGAFDSSRRGYSILRFKKG